MAARRSKKIVLDIEEGADVVMVKAGAGLSRRDRRPPAKPLMCRLPRTMSPASTG